MILTELWHPLVGIIVGLANGMMVTEYLNAKRLTNCLPLTVACVAFSVMTPILIATPFWYIIAVLYLLGAFGVLVYLHQKLTFSSFTYAVCGSMLITFGMSAIPLAANNNASSSFFFVLIVLLPWMADGGGYFIGGYCGKRKLCPSISPAKTVEGALGGAVFCVASALLMGLSFQFIVFSGDNAIRVNFASLVVLAILDSILSIIGDISFSLIKRYLKIKDYGTIFPGHGGMLDRCDSVIFTAPLVVILGQFMPFLQIMV